MGRGGLNAITIVCPSSVWMSVSCLNRVRTPEPLSSQRTWVVGPAGACATTNSMRSARYRSLRETAIHCAGWFWALQTVSGSPSMAFWTESSPEETRTVPCRATFGLDVAGTGVFVGAGARVGVGVETAVGVAGFVGCWVAVSPAVGRSGSDRAEQEDESIRISSRPVNAKAFLIRGLI